MHAGLGRCSIERQTKSQQRVAPVPSASRERSFGAVGLLSARRGERWSLSGWPRPPAPPSKAHGSPHLLQGSHTPDQIHMAARRWRQCVPSLCDGVDHSVAHHRGRTARRVNSYLEHGVTHDGHPPPRLPPQGEATEPPSAPPSFRLFNRFCARDEAVAWASDCLPPARCRHEWRFPRR